MNDHRKPRRNGYRIFAHALVKELFGTDDYMGEHEEKTITQRLKEQIGPPDPRVAERMRWEGLEDLANYMSSPKCIGNTNEHAIRFMRRFLPKVSQEIRAIAKAQRQRQIHREK